MFARKIPTGYEFREGGEMLPTDIPLTREEFNALCEERAMLTADGQIIYPDQVA